MNWLLNLGIVLITIVVTEAFAWFKHKYLLHGPLWFLHKSHHTPRKGLFEWNDLIIIIYIIPAALLIYYGIEKQHFSLWIGVGITLYGIIYFILHDVIIHRRIKLKFKTDSNYLKRLIRAHKMHHKHQEKEDSEAFGFLYAKKKYQP